MVRRVVPRGRCQVIHCGGGGEAPMYTRGRRRLMSGCRQSVFGHGVLLERRAGCCDGVQRECGPANFPRCSDGAFILLHNKERRGCVCGSERQHTSAPCRCLSGRSQREGSPEDVSRGLGGLQKCPKATAPTHRPRSPDLFTGRDTGSKQNVSRGRDNVLQDRSDQDARRSSRQMHVAKRHRSNVCRPHNNAVLARLHRLPDLHRRRRILAA